MQLIPKSHHFECDYTLIILPPKIQSNETTELKQPIRFKFRYTKNVKLTFSTQVVFLKVNFYTKLLNLNLHLNAGNIQLNKQKMTDNKILKNINKILQN